LFGKHIFQKQYFQRSGAWLYRKRIWNKEWNGTFLRIYGEIVYDLKSRIAKINKPEFFFLDKKDLIQEIKSKLKRLRVISFFLMIPLLICVVKLILICKKKYFDSRIEQKKYKNSKLIIENFKCSICLSNSLNLICYPCEHLCLCRDCYSNKMNINEKTCPKCKTVI
jgi:Zinc finger, C3HC4 type (RING finger)